jgi:hypothetical protein
MTCAEHAHPSVGHSCQFTDHDQRIASLTSPAASLSPLGVSPLSSCRWRAALGAGLPPPLLRWTAGLPRIAGDLRSSKCGVATLARAWADCKVRLNSHGLATVATSRNVDAAQIRQRRLLTGRRWSVVGSPGTVIWRSVFEWLSRFDERQEPCDVPIDAGSGRTSSRSSRSRC